MAPQRFGEGVLYIPRKNCWSVRSADLNSHPTQLVGILTNDSKRFVRDVGRNSTEPFVRMPIWNGRPARQIDARIANETNEGWGT
jgi:hypothetical protein